MSARPSQNVSSLTIDNHNISGVYTENLYTYGGNTSYTKNESKASVLENLLTSNRLMETIQGHQLVIADRGLRNTMI